MAMNNHKETDQVYQIYALVDPRDKAVRYVGMSKDAQARLSGHLMGNYGNMHEGRWIRKLHENGLRPILEILETINAGSNSYALACEREIYWIHKMTHSGHTLFNVSGNKYPYKSSSKISKGCGSEKANISIDRIKSVVKDERELVVRQVAQGFKGGKQNNQPASMSEEKSLAIRDVVIEMSVNEKTVRRWIQNGELHATKDIFGPYKITRSDLDDFIRRRTEKYNTSSED